MGFFVTFVDELGREAPGYPFEFFATPDHVMEFMVFDLPTIERELRELGGKDQVIRLRHLPEEHWLRKLLAQEIEFVRLSY